VHKGGRFWLYLLLTPAESSRFAQNMRS
jgi:hypothetical protein